MRQLTFSEPPAMLNVEIPTFVLRGSGRDLHYEYLVKVCVFLFLSYKLEKKMEGIICYF